MCEREHYLTSITQKTFFKKQILISFRRIYLWVEVFNRILHNRVMQRHIRSCLYLSDLVDLWALSWDGNNLH